MTKLDLIDNINLPGIPLIGTLIRRSVLTAFKYNFLHSPDILNVKISWGKRSIDKYSHFEDVEPWEEKANFLFSKLDVDCDINVEHEVIDKKFVWDKKIEYITFFDIPAVDIFRNNLKQKKGKVCFWMFDMNAISFKYGKPESEFQRAGKINTYSEDQWYQILGYLKSRFDVVELDYRTPIREVYYHLSTCEFVFSYAGMYHNIVTVLNKPIISILNTKYYPEGFPQNRAPYELLCLPNFNDLLNDKYFDSLIQEAKSLRRLKNVH